MKCCQGLFLSYVVVLDALSSFWSDWGFSAGSSFHTSICCFPRRSLARVVPPPPRRHLCEDEYNNTCPSRGAAARFARGPLGKVLQKVRCCYPTACWVPEHPSVPGRAALIWQGRHSPRFWRTQWDGSLRYRFLSHQQKLLRHSTCCLASGSYSKSLVTCVTTTSLGFFVLLRGGDTGWRQQHPSQAFLCVRAVQSRCWFYSLTINAECK